MDSVLQYGPVFITKGDHKGQIGYYDDEDDNGKLIIYPNIPIHCRNYYKVSKLSVTSIIATGSLAKRLEEIDRILYRNHAKEDLSSKEEIELLHEKDLCTTLLETRYLHSVRELQSHYKTDVFISHSSRDLAFSRCLATDLQEIGLSVFLDDWSINIGERIFEKINNGLQNSKALIMIVSKDYLESVCCKDEWGAFYGKVLHDNSCVIYPVLIDNSQPPVLISQIKYFRFNIDEYSASLSALYKALKKQFGEVVPQ